MHIYRVGNKQKKPFQLHLMWVTWGEVRITFKCFKNLKHSGGHLTSISNNHISQVLLQLPTSTAFLHGFYMQAKLKPTWKDI